MSAHSIMSQPSLRAKTLGWRYAGCFSKEILYENTAIHIEYRVCYMRAMMVHDERLLGSRTETRVTHFTDTE